MLLTKKEYNEVRATRERCGLKVKSWLQPAGVGSSRDDPGTLGFRK